MHGQEWALRINLNGEWEECRFPTQVEALDAFQALTVDYASGIKRAILFRIGLDRTTKTSYPANVYIN